MIKVNAPHCAEASLLNDGLTPKAISAPHGSTLMESKRIRLLKFVVCFGIGGTERQVVNFARGLDSSRFELHLACLKRWGQFLKEIEESRRPLVEYPINCLYSYNSWIQRLKLATYLKRNRIHIVHTYDFSTNLFAIPAAWLAGVPVIVASIRNTAGYLTPAQSQVQRLMCRLADRIVVNAEAIRQGLIAEGYDPETVTVIRNGIDLSRFARNGSDGRLRHELDLPPHAPLVAVLARLHPMKGIEDFLEAARIVSRGFPEARFLVVGSRSIPQDGDVREDVAHKKELENYAVRLGLKERVVFTGFRLDVPEILSEVAVSVLSSVTSEGLSNSLLESMAMGVPAVATTVGGSPEVVQDGVTGLLVPPRDPAALARAICLLLENRAMAFRLGQAGKQRVTEHFSLEKMVRETERLYLSLLGAYPAL
jgi:glycosyltransferase involved in cell wall biosynthesis